METMGLVQIKDLEHGDGRRFLGTAGAVDEAGCLTSEGIRFIETRLRVEFTEGLGLQAML